MNASTVASTCTSPSLGSEAGASPTSASRPQSANQQAEQTPGDGDHQRLREQLPHQPAAAGAERDTCGQLGVTPRSLTEDQARDVGAADRQHQRHRDLEQQDKTPDSTNHLLVQRHDACAEPFVGVGIHAREPGHDCAELVTGCRRANARDQPPHDEQQVRIADGCDVAREWEAAGDAAIAAHPELDVLHHRHRKVRRQHADDRVGASVEH